MPCVVCFEDSRVLRIVKTSWCENFKNAETKNNGKPHSDLVKISIQTTRPKKPILIWKNWKSSMKTDLLVTLVMLCKYVVSKFTFATVTTTVYVISNDDYRK